MTYIGTNKNLLLLNNGGFPLNIKVKDVRKIMNKLYINYSSYPKHKAVMVDLHTKIATLAN
jgi:hypothetical protein